MLLRRAHAAVVVWLMLLAARSLAQEPFSSADFEVRPWQAENASLGATGEGRFTPQVPACDCATCADGSCPPGWCPQCGGVPPPAPDAFQKLPWLDPLYAMEWACDEADRIFGQPTPGTSWKNRPLHVDTFLGGYWGDDLFAGVREQGNSTYYGLRLGRDYSALFALEMRLAFAEPNVETPTEMRLNGEVDVVMWDISGVYYPFGDSWLRPYFTAGIGLTYFSFLDLNNVPRNESMVGVPIGVGLKHTILDQWGLIRLEVLNNIAHSDSNLGTMHNFTFAGGIELRFGGRRPNYWPWNPGSYLP